MFMILLLLFLLVSACVVIHGVGMLFGLRWLSLVWRHHGDRLDLTIMFGILMFGWSTGVLFSVVNHLQGAFMEARHHP